MSKKRKSFSPEFKSKVGRQSIQIDWLKKNLRKCLDLTTRVSLVRNLKDSKETPPTIKDAAELLDINRTSVYYKVRQVSDTELEIMNHIDQMHTNHPTWGKCQLASQMQDMGYKIGKYKVRRFMDLMGIEVIYPKPNLSKPAKGHKVYPYLLRNKIATAPNQIWSIDYHIHTLRAWIRLFDSYHRQVQPLYCRLAP